MSRGQLHTFVAALILGIGCNKTQDPAPMLGWNIPSPPDHFGPQFIPSDNPMTSSKWELGRKLFFDSKLSSDGKVSCASCHLPAQAFGGASKTSVGSGGAVGKRNVPALTNMGWHPYFTREGGVPTLEMQVLVPIQETNELNHNIVLIAEALKNDPVYVSMTTEAFDMPPSPFTITRALASFQRSLISGSSAYDRWLEGDRLALSHSAVRGQKIFNSIGCDQCHSGPQFSDFELRNNGLFKIYPDSGLYQLTLNPDDIGKFKTASLRNLSFTAPYMFDGSLNTLDEVIAHYAEGGSHPINQSLEIRPFQITTQEKSDLKAFLRSLDDPNFITWCSTLSTP